MFFSSHLENLPKRVPTVNKRDVSWFETEYALVDGINACPNCAESDIVYCCSADSADAGSGRHWAAPAGPRPLAAVHRALRALAPPAAPAVPAPSGQHALRESNVQHNIALKRANKINCRTPH